MAAILSRPQWVNWTYTLRYSLLHWFNNSLLGCSRLKWKIRMKVVKWQQLNSTFKLTFHTSEDIVLKEFMTKTEPILYIKLVTWNLTLRRIESFDYPGSASYLLGKAFVTERMRYIFNASHWLRPRSAIDRKWTVINMKIHIIAMAYGCQRFRFRFRRRLFDRFTWNTFVNIITHTHIHRDISWTHTVTENRRSSTRQPRSHRWQHELL